MIVRQVNKDAEHKVEEGLKKIFDFYFPLDHREAEVSQETLLMLTGMNINEIESKNALCIGL